MNKNSKLRYLITVVLFFVVCSLVYFIVDVNAKRNSNNFSIETENQLSDLDKEVDELINKVSGKSNDQITSNLSVADVVELATPGVVTVKTISMIGNTSAVSSIGTGFFINPTRILTNQHVVGNEKNVEIVLHDGTNLSAKVLNTDVVNDMALLEVTTPGFESSTVLKLGSSEKVRVGEWVVAIGSPLDLSFSNSASVGIISGLSRSVETSSGVSTFIQTDAAINPGNSGGPLLNLKGEVIGINTAKLVSDGVEGIGFAIPIDLAKIKLEELSKPVVSLGIAGIDIKPGMGLTVKHGVYVVQVDADSPSNIAGMLPGDIVLKFAGQDVKTIDDINEIKKSVDYGQSIEVEILRHGNRIKLVCNF